jgi:hypothetical protein
MDGSRGLTLAVSQPFANNVHDDRDHDPQSDRIQSIPHRFLATCQTRGTENDQGACGAHMYKLSQQQALCVAMVQQISTLVAVMTDVNARKNGNQYAPCGVAVPR